MVGLVLVVVVVFSVVFLGLGLTVVFVVVSSFVAADKVGVTLLG